MTHIANGIDRLFTLLGKPLNWFIVALDKAVEHVAGVIRRM